MKQHQKSPDFPNSKRWMFRAIAFIAISGLLVCIRLLCSERTLTDKAKQVSILKGDAFSMVWLSSDSLLIVKTDENRNGGDGIFQWKGKASLFFIATTKLTDLPRLTKSFEKSGFDYSTLEPSPDGTRVLWNRGVSNDKPYPATALLSGEQLKFWNVEKNAAASGWIDATHYVELQRNLKAIRVNDVENLNQNSILSCNAPRGKQIYDAFMHAPFEVLEVKRSSDEMYRFLNNCVDIRRYSSEEYYKHGEDYAEPLFTRTILFPAESDFSSCITSLQHNRIIYSVFEKHSTPIQEFISKIIPFPKLNELQTESLWMSSADGIHLRLLGDQPMQMNQKLENIQFTRGGNAISFKFGDSLYYMLLPN